MRTLLLKVRGSAQSLVERIMSGAIEWGWGNNKENVGKLQEKLGNVINSLSPAMQEFVAGGEIKKLLTIVGGQSELTVEFIHFCSLKQQVEDIEQCRKTLLKRRKC